MVPRLIIADDNPLLRDALKNALAGSNMEIIGEAGDGIETMEKVEELEPDILLLDMNMPELDGLTVLERLKTIRPNLKIIVFSIYDHYTEAVLEAGADGYFAKESDTDLLIAGIERVFRGESFSG